MKNNECEIQIVMPSGWIQTWRKKGQYHWMQTTNGVERVATAEQFISHILPILADGYSGPAKIRVIPDKLTE